MFTGNDTPDNIKTFAWCKRSMAVYMYSDYMARVNSGSDMSEANESDVTDIDFEL